MRKILFILFLLVTANSSFAEDRCTTWGCVSPIETLYTNASGVIYVGTPFAEINANCTPVSDVYFTLNPDRPNAKEVYTSLLGAYLANKKIQLRIVEGSEGCQLAYVRLDATF